MKEICVKIDHLVVLCQNPQESITHFSRLFGLPDYIPVKNQGNFESGLVNLGNIDIEFIRIGSIKTQDSLYGLCFATDYSIDDLCAALFSKQIQFSLPLTTNITEPFPLQWTVVFLKNYLDNPFPAWFLPKIIASSPRFTRHLEKFIGWLIKPQWIKNACSKKKWSIDDFFLQVFSEP